MREFRYRNPSKPTSTYSDTPSAPGVSIRQVVHPSESRPFATSNERIRSGLVPSRSSALTPASPRVYSG
ncbi:hypothetical protein OIDMADRAFT_21600 [Oidiodendron maius Zn]|uniref:Uncharacterized protein n=1 Tax=Oidiodendron maius (strain Zn) TaxID=913774 RepID=A0A0C3GN90_OIDMZ|nr:hypothetical protein OIDMADRAFT_21600 [Oidiodendron maius Zn]